MGHQDTLKLMASAKCYVSTMPVESWGITCMEALLHGVPVILLCDKNGKHASEIIPARDWHYKKMDKNCTPDELIEELNACKLFTYMDRMEISRENKQKHSKEKWVDKWNKMVYNTPFNIEEKSTLTAFM